MPRRRSYYLYKIDEPVGRTFDVYSRILEPNKNLNAYMDEKQRDQANKHLVMGQVYE